MCKEYRKPEYMVVDAQGAANPVALLQDYLTMEGQEDWRVHTIDLAVGRALLIREKKQAPIRYEKAWMNLPA